MADVFLSYAREDRHRAAEVAAALTRRGRTVWWDRQLLPGDTFEQAIARQLAEARCVIVLWSRTSVASDWVRDEAGEARKARKLVPALIDDVSPPFGFRQYQSANLVAWTGNDSDPEFALLLQGVETIAPPSSFASAPATTHTGDQPAAPGNEVGSEPAVGTATSPARVKLPSDATAAAPETSGSSPGNHPRRWYRSRVALIALVVITGLAAAIALTVLQSPPTSQAPPDDPVSHEPVVEQNHPADVARSASDLRWIPWNESFYAAYSVVPASLDLGTMAEADVPVRAVLVTANFFDMFPTPPLFWGTAFGTGVIDARTPCQLVLSHRTWSRLFGRDPSVIQKRTVKLNGGDCTVIGVTGQEFGYPRDADLWTTVMSASTVAMPTVIHRPN
jgi:hypothetical protein